ncbi:hypothetical protein [Paenibacillus koleovorans]|uniref:hypothetical protein n=1 Tax=Paenibacillus koleovorans TaxID=121608 RepID=UPI0013E320EE|nr:hypothetical protein [Paenibacillus koleovorans]
MLGTIGTTPIGWELYTNPWTPQLQLAIWNVARQSERGSIRTAPGAEADYLSE